ncbi:uracil-DNA glycosylase family protein [Patulibacter sp. SYSU D01012]|uniref:uracil-DNA glycosylase family protein n=1 Tax=Patulibacter sp. SYSU D01012 TaxID=2817381 RepID=UPI001B30E729|nr:uracil-DNA glycosylase family protein [Patulibacter sp. SYSU D01012]
MPVTDDEIHEKYLERAIREINALNHDVQDARPDGEGVAVVGSGHPQADVLLLKHHATRAEAEEGVAFYGRTGSALLKSLARLGIDPTTVYGTLCDKWPGAGPELAAEGARVLAEELAIVQPRIVVVMGPDALEVLNGLDVPLAEPVRDLPGVVQRFTPATQALVTPPLDDALDELTAKQAFWTAFRELGAWHDRLPPY